MSYTVKKSNGTTLVTVADQTIDTSATSLSLVGRGAVNYGLAFAENFVYLLENFANANAPALPTPGQIWYDTSTGTMKFYDGAAWHTFGSGLVTVGGTRASGAFGITITNGSESWSIAGMLSEGRIITVWSHFAIPYNKLPANVVIEGVSYILAARFPSGIDTGMTMATDPNDYEMAGRATSAEYADVAERYAASEPMVAGDVVEIGGDKEIQLTRAEFSGAIFGVISTKPAFKLNAKAGTDETHPYVALLGRVPCKVIGPVKKGDRLVSSQVPGVAMVVNTSIRPGFNAHMVLGRALADKDTAEVGLVEIVLSGVR